MSTMRRDTQPSPAGEGLVDGSLIDAMLDLTPAERLRLNDRMIQTIEELRDAVAAAAQDRSQHADP